MTLLLSRKGSMSVCSALCTIPEQHACMLLLRALNREEWFMHDLWCAEIIQGGCVCVSPLLAHDTQSMFDVY